MTPEPSVDVLAAQVRAYLLRKFKPGVGGDPDAHEALDALDVLVGYAKRAEPAKPRDSYWERHEAVACVECPSCGFTFDADHTTVATEMSDREPLSESERRWLASMPAWSDASGRTIAEKFDRLLRLEPFEALWRCDGCGMEQITPRDDPPARCPRCQHPSVFWVKGAGRLDQESQR